VIVYVDTSAAMKLVVDEAESAALAEMLEASKKDASKTLVTSLLLYTELHCAAKRRPEEISPDAVAEVLATLALVDVESSDLRTAAHLPGRLRSADAIHLATALRVDARAIVLYDAELKAEAARAGIETISPQ
jgi:predicted nucleic acid-binding protein